MAITTTENWIEEVSKPIVREFFIKMSKKHNVDIDSLNLHMANGGIYVQKYTPGNPEMFQMLEIIKSDEPNKGIVPQIKENPNQTYSGSEISIEDIRDLKSKLKFKENIPKSYDGMKDNKIMLLEEDLECIKRYLDDLNIDREDEMGNVYSIVGRIKLLQTLQL